jgi:hypothetical protein
MFDGSFHKIKLGILLENVPVLRCYSKITIPRKWTRMRSKTKTKTAEQVRTLTV